MKNFFQTHASAIGLIASGIALYVQGDKTQGIAMIGSGVFSFFIKKAAQQKTTP